MDMDFFDVGIVLNIPYTQRLGFKSLFALIFIHHRSLLLHYIHHILNHVLHKCIKLMTRQSPNYFYHHLKCSSRQILSFFTPKPHTSLNWMCYDCHVLGYYSYEEHMECLGLIVISSGHWSNLGRYAYSYVFISNLEGAFPLITSVLSLSY